MEKYVLGFIFEKDLKHVYLIRKQRPRWQKGKLNGIGGHVNEKESFDEAMKREAIEEADYLGEFTSFGKTSEGRFELYFYYSICNENLIPKTTTDEKIERISIESLLSFKENVVPDLCLIIPMAIDIIEGKSK